MTGEANPHDPGLQPERTALAWQRTGLSAAVVAVLLLRYGVAAGAALWIVGGVCAAVVVVLAALAGRDVPATRVRLTLVTLAVIGAGVCTTLHGLHRMIN